MLNHLPYQELKIDTTIALAFNVRSWTVLQDHIYHKANVARSAQVTNKRLTFSSKKSLFKTDTLYETQLNSFFLLIRRARRQGFKQVKRLIGRI